MEEEPKVGKDDLDELEDRLEEARLEKKFAKKRYGGKYKSARHSK